jgi:hypothetical protein
MNKLSDLFESDDFTCKVMGYDDSGVPLIRISSEDQDVIARYSRFKKSRLIRNCLEDDADVSVYSAAIRQTFLFIPQPLELG